jgi:hypothetical protein
MHAVSSSCRVRVKRASAARGSISMGRMAHLSACHGPAGATGILGWSTNGVGC